MPMPLPVILPRRFFFRHLFAAIVAWAAFTLPAQAEVGAAKISSTEDVVIAFYKTGNARPNFEKWIVEREPYRTTALALRPELMDKEMTRLKNAYAAFNPQTDLLTVRTEGMVRVGQFQDPAQPGATITRLDISFRAGEADYFPYDFMGERFAVIPKDLQKLLKPTIQNQQYPYMRDVLKNGKPVTIILELRPAKADMEAPFNLDGTGGGPDAEDGKGQWMFLTDVAAISIWNAKGSMLWEYTAPWYITPIRDSLLDLHTDKSAD